MEIESEDKERQHYYQNEFFIEKVNYSLNVIFKVINNKKWIVNKMLNMSKICH